MECYLEFFLAILFNGRNTLKLLSFLLTSTTTLYKYMYKKLFIKLNKLEWAGTIKK